MAYEDSAAKALVTRFDDVYLLAGARTPFADYMGVLRDANPIDLAIHVVRSLFQRSGVPAAEVQAVIAGNMAQAGFDAYYLPRHIGLYAGVPQTAPALLANRICGTGFETIAQAAQLISLGGAQLVLAAGAESMSRNPVAAYTHRAGFRMGQIEFKDFLWEAFTDPATRLGMGDTAENVARQYGITRADVDAYAARSFAAAVAAWDSGYFADEVAALGNAEFALPGYQSRALRLADRKDGFARDEHVKPTPLETLAKLKPAFKGVQTGGNSSAIVDGAAAMLVASGAYVRAHGVKPLARLVAASTAGLPPEVMGMGPAPAIRAVLAGSRMQLGDIGRVEINEAFGAQYLGCERELGLDRSRTNTRGGAIAIGHPLSATGLRLTHTVARQLALDDQQFGIASACIGGGQGMALLLERAH